MRTASDDPVDDGDLDAAFLVGNENEEESQNRIRQGRSSTVDAGSVARLSAKNLSVGLAGSPTVERSTHEESSILPFDSLLKFQQTASAVFDSLVWSATKAPEPVETVKSLQAENSKLRKELELSRSHQTENETLKSCLNRLSIDLDTARISITTLERENRLIVSQLEKLQQMHVQKTDSLVDGWSQTNHVSHANAASQMEPSTGDVCTQVGGSLKRLHRDHGQASHVSVSEYEELESRYKILERRSQQKIRDLQKILGKTLTSP